MAEKKHAGHSPARRAARRDELRAMRAAAAALKASLREARKRKTAE